LKTLAREVGRTGLTVNAVAPGRIATRTFEEFYRHRSADEDLAGIPLGRFGDPGDVGDLVCFLASERAGYISGALIPIDGAMTRSMH
jgi:3-oxoacyl-[acyl-carrier protein] reductase